MPPSFSSLLALCLIACSGDLGPTTVSPTAPNADEITPPPGVADRGDDPAVVAIYAGENVICSGALVAPDVVLTARECVSKWAPLGSCHGPATHLAGPLPAQLLRIVVADFVTPAQERARGRDVFVPPACSADIAVVSLDTPIDDIVPLALRSLGAAKGERLRTVGFERPDSSSLFAKVVRDHLPVLATTSTELQIGEACERGPGAPAIDESTGEVVGLSSRRMGPGCIGSSAFDAYTRTDAFLGFIAEIAAKGFVTGGLAKGRKKTRKGPIDMGANCSRGADCASGVCVAHKSQQYCSRACGTQDHCPSHFRCQKSSEGVSVCIER